MNEMDEGQADDDQTMMEAGDEGERKEPAEQHTLEGSRRRTTITYRTST